MIAPVRFACAAVWHTGLNGSRALLAAWRGRPDTPGGPYDRSSFDWSEALLRAGRVTVQVEGRENLLPRPCVYVSNHVSMIDIWALMVILPRPPKFVFKRELMRIPLLGHAARAAGHIVIDRSNRSAAFATYDIAAEVIRQGASACVFAEGTRSRTGRLQPFKKGPFVLAIAAQVPVVPVVVLGSYELMPPGALSPRSGTVVVRVGAEMPTAGMGYDARDALSIRAHAAVVALGAAV